GVRRDLSRLALSGRRACLIRQRLALGDVARRSRRTDLLVLLIAVQDRLGGRACGERHGHEDDRETLHGALMTRWAESRKGGLRRPCDGGRIRHGVAEAAARVAPGARFLLGS